MIRYAVVSELREKRILVTYKGENIKSELPLYYLSSYEPQLGDVVAVDVASSLCLGKVLL